MSSGCQPKRSASSMASSVVGPSMWIQVSPSAWSSAIRGSGRGGASRMGTRGRWRLMRGRLGTGTEGVVGSHIQVRHLSGKALQRPRASSLLPIDWNGETGAGSRARTGPLAVGRRTSYPVARGMANLFGYIDPGSGSLFLQLVGEGRLVATEELVERAAFPDAIHGGVAGVLEHDVIPFVSYPYEWSFEMLRDAALLQLGILRRALESGMVLKDSTPYNVQFRGAAPVFIDVGSFEPLREGEPWSGYRPFCMLFLYPLP